MARPLSVVARKTLKRFRLRRDPDLVSVADQIARPGREQQIPRVVYQTAESRMVHPTHARSIAAFRGLNPEFDFKLFDAQERDYYMHDAWRGHPILEVYSGATFGQMKADIFRYCIVFERGGYYFDFNKGCAVPLLDLHEPDTFGLVSYEQNPALLFPIPELAARLGNPHNLVLQWAFGFAREHPFMAEVIGRICRAAPFFKGVLFPVPKHAILALTGPGMFTSVYRDAFSQGSLGGVTEAGIDLNNHGVFRLRGSKFLEPKSPYYGEVVNQYILH